MAWKWTDIELTRLLSDVLSIPGSKLNSLFLNKAVETTATVDPGSIAAGASLAVTVTVTGATTAMGVVVQPPATFNAGLLWSARVSAVDTVELRIFNSTVGAIDPASGSWGFWVTS